MIQLNDKKYWLYPAGNPNTNRLLHLCLFPTQAQALAEMFPSELREKHLVTGATLLVDSAP